MKIENGLGTKTVIGEMYEMKKSYTKHENNSIHSNFKIFHWNTKLDTDWLFYNYCIRKMCWPEKHHLMILYNSDFDEIIGEIIFYKLLASHQ